LRFTIGTANTDTSLDAITLIATVIDNILSLYPLLKDGVIVLWRGCRELTVDEPTLATNHKA